MLHPALLTGALLLAQAVLAMPVAAQNQGGALDKVIRAVRVNTPPVIDGVMDEAVWD